MYVAITFTSEGRNSNDDGLCVQGEGNTLNRACLAYAHAGGYKLSPRCELLYSSSYNCKTRICLYIGGESVEILLGKRLVTLMQEKTSDNLFIGNIYHFTRSMFH